MIGFNLNVDLRDFVFDLSHCPDLEIKASGLGAIMVRIWFQNLELQTLVLISVQEYST